MPGEDEHQGHQRASTTLLPEAPGRQAEGEHPNGLGARDPADTGAEAHGGRGGLEAHDGSEARAEHARGPSGIVKWLTSTDHKVIGASYMLTALVVFFIAGVMALLIRTQLASPQSSLLDFQQYNELFTMHGALMIYLFVGPFAFGGLANYIVPLQVGAPDMAFPRLNALSYWLYLGGTITMLMGFFTAGGAASFAWVAYAPLSSAVHSPGAGSDLFIMALLLSGFSAVFTGVNLITTIFYLRAPGMTMTRLPIFTWNMLVVALLILIAFPVLTAALIMLYADRHFGMHLFTVKGGGVPVLYQHLFWFFGHPEVYILALPFFGVVTEIIPVFSRKPLFGYKGMIYATIAIAALSTGVWAHHMFTTGVVLLPFFSLLSLLIAVPTGIKFFNWIGTMWRGQIKFDTPMLFCIGFLFTFLLGGLTGVMLAEPPIDFATHDTYFVVAHFHSVVMALVMAAMAGLYYWGPKMTGLMLREKLGKLHFWLMFIGSSVTFLPQYALGLEGMPRRVSTYPAGVGWHTLNEVSTAGAFVIAASILVFAANLWVSWRKPVMAGANPWDAHTLEWFTTSPPPHHNFTKLPRIRSERPTWDFYHPDVRTITHNGHVRSTEPVSSAPEPEA
ncbi:MAG: cytochrome c oxidase subunit I [Acidimicrobiales bacterium]|jgi:cytochrome c oxidase subunit 1|nr:cytochrome c oxidase subunit I [Actinomycetota bacterium]